MFAQIIIFLSLLLVVSSSICFEIFGPKPSKISNIIPTTPSTQNNTVKSNTTTPFEQTTTPFEQTTTPFEQTTTPFEQTTTPFEQTTTPYEQTTTPFTQTTTPYEQTTTPFEQTTTPYEQTTTPYEQTTTPYEQTTTPFTQTTTPYEQTTTPYEQTTTPYEQTTTPYEQTTTPYEQTTTPYEQTTTPYEQTTTPYEQTTTPYEQTTTPYEQTTTPYEQTTTPIPPEKYITSSEDCTAAGGDNYSYCPETQKHYCCGVKSGSGYLQCGGTDGQCPSNDGLKYCVCPPFEQTTTPFEQTTTTPYYQTIPAASTTVENKQPNFNIWEISTTTTNSGTIKWNQSEPCDLNGQYDFTLSNWVVKTANNGKSYLSYENGKISTLENQTIDDMNNLIQYSYNEGYITSPETGIDTKLLICSGN